MSRSRAGTQKMDRAQSGTNAGETVVTIRNSTGSFSTFAPLQKGLSHVPGSFLKAAHITASSSHDMKMFVSNVQP